MKPDLNSLDDLNGDIHNQDDLVDGVLDLETQRRLGCGPLSRSFSFAPTTATAPAASSSHLT